MNDGAGFPAGAGRAEIRLNAALPMEGFTAINDPLHFRALIMETDERAAIASAPAFGTTATAMQVNGGDKCIPEAEAYTLCKFQGQHSPFMPGSAEALRREAEALIETLAC